MKANLKTGLLIEPHYLERNKFARELPVIDDGQTMISGSYNTIYADVKGETINELYSFNGSVGGGSAVTTNNFRKDLTSGSIEVKNNKGRRVEQGTNGTIDVNGIVLDEKQQAAQAPIKPFTSTKGQFYIDYRSSTLLGKENHLVGIINLGNIINLDNNKIWENFHKV